MRLIAIATVICALSQPLGAQEPALVQQYSIPGHGSLQLRVPQGWRAVSKSLEKPPSVVFRFAPPSGDAFNLQVTSVWLEPEKIATLTPDSIKAGVRAAAAKMLAEAVEKEATLVELRGPQSSGYHISLTRRGPAKDANDYKHITQGTVRIGEVITVFTLLYGDSAPAAKEQVLRMFAGATYSR